MTEPESRMPEKASDCLLLALRDLRAAEESPHYVVSMSDWHQWHNGHRVCYVCFAGAVMAGTFGVPLRKSMCPNIGHGFSQHDVARLRFLDKVQRGKVEDGLITLGLGVTAAHKFIRHIMAYRHGRDAFHMAIEKLIADLQKDGL